MTSKKCFFTTISDVKPFIDESVTKIQIGIVDSNNTIVGINTKPGDTGILFYPGAELSEQFMLKYGLKPSYFKNKKIVKVSRFKGIYSDVLFLPASKEEVDELFEGNYCLGDFLPEKENVYKEYIPQYKTAKTNTQSSGNAKPKIIKEYFNFPEHVDTEQYRSCIGEIRNKFNDGWSLSVSLKVHGTSGRCANIHCLKPPNKFEKFLSNFLFKFNNKYMQKLSTLYDSFLTNKNGQYKIVSGTRRTVLNKNSNGYYSNEFRDKTVYFANRIPKNYIVYFEVFGWENEDRPIMAPYNGIPFCYGLDEGNFGINVYRVVNDGIDLDVHELEDFCTKVLFLSSVKRLSPIFNTKYESFNTVEKLIKNYLELSSDNKVIYNTNEDLDFEFLGYTHINEGIVIRLDPPESLKTVSNPKFFKLKLSEFYYAEGLVNLATLSEKFLEQE